MSATRSGDLQSKLKQLNSQKLAAKAKRESNATTNPKRLQMLTEECLRNVSLVEQQGAPTTLSPYEKVDTIQQHKEHVDETGSVCISDDTF